MRSRIPALALAVVGLGLGPLLAVVFLAALFVEGYPMPHELYYLMSRRVKTLPSTRMMARPGPVPRPLPTAEEMRDIAFEWYNVRPQARGWMNRLPIQYREMVEWGSYDPRTRSVSVDQPYVPVLIHEYAHANFDRKPIWQKLAWAFDMMRLWYDEGADSAEAQEVVHEELAVALHFAEEGKQYNFVLETYAHLAELGGGDLTTLPSYLQWFYADYLTPAPTAWTAKRVGGIERVDISSLAIGP